MSTPKYDDLHRVAITGIIWKKDTDGSIRYLITKRSPHKKIWPNKWTVPGGGLEVSDYIDTPSSYVDSGSPQWYNSTEVTLAREIKEEVGLTVGNPQFLLSLTFIRPDGIPVLVLSFYSEYGSGEVVLDEDATEFAWITADQIKDYDLIQGIDHEIVMVDERLRGASL